MHLPCLFPILIYEIPCNSTLQISVQMSSPLCILPSVFFSFSSTPPPWNSRVSYFCILTAPFTYGCYSIYHIILSLFTCLSAPLSWSPKKSGTKSFTSVNSQHLMPGTHRAFSEDLLGKWNQWFRHLKRWYLNIKYFVHLKEIIILNEHSTK